ncbi:glycoside hydrolase family 2 protein [Paraburkholderia sp. SIMBA_054]
MTLLPGETTTVRISSTASLDALHAALRLRSLADAVQHPSR